jgi:hypothetical protein
MSEDYARGYSGQARNADTDEGEYRRGMEDREAGLARSGRGGMDLSRATSEAAVIADRWVERPDWTLYRMLLSWVMISGVIGAIAAAVSWPIHAWLWGGLYTTDAPNLLSSLNWGLKIGGFVFFLTGVMTVGQLLGNLIRRFTLFGLLALFGVIGILIYIVWWLYALSAGMVTSPAWMR